MPRLQGEEESREVTTSYAVPISVPHRSLSPNARAHWATRAKHKKASREEACAVAWKMLGTARPKWARCTIDVLWYGKTKNVLRMDRTNAIGSLKAAEDGLVDSGLLADDHGVEWGSVGFRVDAELPRVMLVVTAPSEGHEGGRDG